MSRRRDNGWEDDSAFYSSSQVEAVLELAKVEVVSDTATHFLAYCPFHGNTDSPALAVDKTTGQFHCFNPSCGDSGELVELLMRLQGLNPFQATRCIITNKNATATPFAERMREALSTPEEFPEFPQVALDRMYADFKGSVAEEYMKSRGFTDETLDYFRVGYSAKKNMVTVPMHDLTGKPIGLIGRTPSHTDKTFKNSVNLPKSRTAWNIHRAKKCGDTVIICEASYDAMRIHQAGYPNVVALLGGHITEFHVQQLSKFFSKIIIMTDMDKKKIVPNCRPCREAKVPRIDGVACNGHRAGRDLGRAIANRLPTKKIMWAAYDDTCIFPHNAKDAGDMTDDEIRQCLRNAVSNLEYSMWDIE